MTRYLLDTNIVSDLIHNPGGRAAGCVARVGEDAVCTSIIVAAELRYGALRRGSAPLSARLGQVLERLEILPFEHPADTAYGELRVALEAAGTPIGANDMLIAAQAISAGITLVTNNEREFRRVANLVVENWLTGDE